MVTGKLVLAVGVGTIGMLLQMMYRSKCYNLERWKIAVLCIMLAVTGTAGTLFMYRIENGFFGGRSFFGALFFVPIFMLPVSWILRITWGKVLDLCAAAECIMLAIMKIDCIIHDCCYGIELFQTDAEKIIRFPSQIVELVVALLIMFYLMKIEKNTENRNLLYPMYMILYGATRFVLNWLRGDLTPFVWILPAGSFWALWSVAIGVLAYVIIKKVSQKSSTN